MRDNRVRTKKVDNQLEKLECAKAAYLRLLLVTFGYLCFTFGLPLVTFGYLWLLMDIALQLFAVLSHTKIFNWSC